MNQPRLYGFFVLAAVACSSGTDDGGPTPSPSTGTGGSAQTTGGAATGGLPGTGGAGISTGGTTGGTSTGGRAASGGATSVGGSSAAGGAQGGSAPSSGGLQNRGGAPSAGQGGGGGAQVSGGSGGASGGGGNRVIKASAGCSKGSAQVTLPNSRIGIPSGYDGKNPVPAVIAFHAAGNDNSSIEGAFKGSDLAKTYLMVYPNSKSATTADKSGWNMQSDKSRYLELEAALLNDACVDENRIYATGHSSGAQFVVQLLCSGDADFDGIAPVASSLYCDKWKNGAVPALVIHGVRDEERTKYGLNDGDGKKDLQPYLTSNMCQTTSTPFDPDLSRCGNVMGVDGKAFDDGCVEFSGCAAKTRWCNHNDPQYGTSNHGIPCFGVRAIYDFFESL